MSYEITFTATAETGQCACCSGDWSENATGHAAVAEMLAHAAMHAITTGHQVTEHTETGRTVRPLSPTDY